MADGGSVAYQFDHKGLIIAEHSPEKADEVQLAAIDLGADDVESDGELTRVITPMTELQHVRQGLLEAEYTLAESKLEWVPKTLVALSTEDQEKLDHLLDALDSLDDVSDVATNVA